MRIYTLLTMLPFVCASVACAVSAPERRPDLLRTQLDDDWKYWMMQYPEVATAFGYPGQNARWTDYSPSAIDARAKYLKESASRLTAIDRPTPAVNDQLNYDLYRDLLDTAVAGLEFHNDALPIRQVAPHNLLMPINQLEGMTQDIPRTIALMPAASRDDSENIISRLQGVRPVVDQTIALMEQGLAAGFTPPQIAMRDVPAQAEAQVVDDPLKSPMLAAFTTWPAAIPEKDRLNLTARATAAYREAVAPAFKKLHDFLVSRYIPGCRATTAASALPNGGALYAYNVTWHVTTNDTPRQIHEIGLAEVKRIRAEMDAVEASTGFKGSHDEFKRYLRTNPKFFFQGPRTAQGPRPKNQGLLFGRRDDRFHVGEIFLERATAGGGEPVLGPRHAVFKRLVAGDVGRFFELAGVDAQVPVSRLQQTLQLVERQSIVHGERAHDTEPEPLVNQPVERERGFVRRFSASC